RIADARAFDLDTGFDHVSHRPDAHRLAGLRDLERCAGDTRVLAYRSQHCVTVHRETARVVPGRSAEDDVSGREAAHLKTHVRSPRPCHAPSERKALGPVPRWSA